MKIRTLAFALASTVVSAAFSPALTETRSPCVLSGAAAAALDAGPPVAGPVIEGRNLLIDAPAFVAKAAPKGEAHVARAEKGDALKGD